MEVFPYANDLCWNDVTWRWEILMEYFSTKNTHLQSISVLSKNVKNAPNLL